MRHGRPDANKAEIVKFFRDRGGYWIDFTPDQGCDGLLAHDLVVDFVEIKDSSKPPSKRKLTNGERELELSLAVRGITLRVIESIADAKALIGFRYADIGKP